ncbi:MAG: ABC transporter ATP-binding protein [Phycisphaerae bacterium]
MLTAVNLRKSYRMGNTTLEVLRDCSIDVREGEFIVVMGRSGSGKSTLLHLLGALDVPDAGKLTFRNEEFHRRSDEARRIRLRRTSFGFVFQSYYLLPELSVFENVLLTRMVGVSLLNWPGAKSAARKDTAAILERVGLKDRLKHRPNELSGGERQRVALARALVHRPQVLFADEPTGNLDVTAGASIMELLQGLHRDGQTIVMVTHDHSLTRFANRCLVLERGKFTDAEGEFGVREVVGAKG